MINNVKKYLWAYIKVWILYNTVTLYFHSKQNILIEFILNHKLMRATIFKTPKSLKLLFSAIFKIYF